MGNYFKVPEGVKTNKKFIKFFRKCKCCIRLSLLLIEKLQSVFECYEYYHKVQHQKPSLNQDEFDDVFCSLLNDCQEYFKLLEDKESKQASFHEAFVALTVFTKGEFESKIRGLFMAFDLDSSGSIDKKELLNLLQNAIYGLCKLIGIPCPHREDIS